MALWLKGWGNTARCQTSKSEASEYLARIPSSLGVLSMYVGLSLLLPGCWSQGSYSEDADFGGFLSAPSKDLPNALEKSL